MADVDYHIHNGVDTPRINYNDLENAPSTSASPGWTFVSYNTQASATTITISGLDLSVAKNYYIIIDSRNVTAAAAYSAQVNSDTTGSAHRWASHYFKHGNGAGNQSSDTDTSWQLNSGFGDYSIHSTLFLAYNNNTAVANWTTGGVGFGGDSTVRASVTNGGGYYNSNNNITSIKFARNDSNNGDWAVWVFKSSQS